MCLPSHGDLSREAYGILGIVVDAENTIEVVARIKQGINRGRPFAVTTANVNYLVLSLIDTAFRSSIIDSDLCTADGMPIVWLARLLGAPVRERVAGSDLFVALKETSVGDPLKVFLLGGAPGVAECACRSINATPGGLNCVGWLDPGHGDADHLSTPEILRAVSRGDADILAVSLGAKKAQRWFSLNWHRLSIPVRIHVGATFSFESGNTKRAPSVWQDWGFEWVWRIKEEPHLWRRYFSDGLRLFQLVMFRALPLTCFTLLLKKWHGTLSLATALRREPGCAVLTWSGAASAEQLEPARASLEEAISAGNPVYIDMNEVCVLDARITGLLMMARKKVGANTSLCLINVPRSIRFLLSLNGFEDLMCPECPA